MSRRGALACVIAFSMILPSAATFAAEAPDGGTETARPAGEELIDSLQPADDTQTVSASRVVRKDLGSGDEPRVYLIRFHEPAVPTYEGGVAGLAATAPRGANKLDADSRAVVDYREHLEEAQLEFIEEMERNLGRDVEVPYTYQFAVNGIAAVLTPEEAQEIARLPEVADIMPDQERQMHTDRGPQRIGADAAWNAIEALGLPEDYKGEGMVIGVIDTGISPGNDSFADVGADGYDHENPRGRYYGVCDPAYPDYDEDFPCNDKLIGAYNFVNTAPAYDYDGHGSHTSSTAGGNVVRGVTKTVDGTDHSFDISGVAPHANIISYLGCCSLSGLTAAIDQAIQDEVDVINYSIGSDAPSALWSDFDTVGFLNARAAGIFVATSNGNSGPLDATTGSPADAPWIISVGASTHDRYNQNVLTDLMSSAGGLPDIEGKGVTGSLAEEAPIIYAGDVGDPLCLSNSGHEEEFGGKIVVCDRGVNGRVEKSENVAAQGAAGFVLVNDELNGDSLNGDEFAVPGVFIGHADGQALKEWLRNGAADHTARIRGVDFVVDDVYADRMASFSSRGPNRAVDTLVPDVVAPGVDILAALGSGSYDVNEHGFVSGTSMASPHVAGAAALVKQARPSWTPAQIQSALMTTARNHVLNHDGERATPYAQGAGLVDVGAAIMAGLLFDETYENYVAANPDAGGDPRALNLPSFANTSCVGTCQWTRTAQAPVEMEGDVTWSVSTESDPGLVLDVQLSDATVSPGESIQIDVTAEVSPETEGTTVFGWITLTPDDPDVPTVTMPVAVAFSGGDLLDRLQVDTRRNAGSQVIPDQVSLEITDLTSTTALVEADQTSFVLGPDSTPGDPYDTVGDNEVIVLDVPAGTRFLVADTIAAAVGDLDLFVGTGDTPSPETEVCRSTTPTSLESCWVESPEPGQWWVMMQSWWSGSPAPDGEVTMGLAVVPDADTGNAGVEGPATNPAGDPFDLTFHWHLDGAGAGDRYFGFIELGTDPEHPGNIGTIPVTLDRHDDDVTKTATLESSRPVGTALPGDTIRYDITIQPNVTPNDLTYTITDTVPDGLAIDESSVTGGGVVDGQTITWQVEMPSPVGAIGEYTYTTSLTDPTCIPPFGGYVDLFEVAGFQPSGAAGSDAVFQFLSGTPFTFYGEEHLGFPLTPQGFVLFGGEYDGEYWVPQALPDPAEPNGLLAALWADTELVRQDGIPGSGGERGLTVATASGVLAVAEYDNPSMFGDPDAVLGDYQIQMWIGPDEPGPDIFVVFGEPGYLPPDYTIGTEHLGGANGTMVTEDLETLWQPGVTLCFDYTGPSFEPVTLSYEVTVQPNAKPGTYTNRAVHTTDDPYAEEEVATAAVQVKAKGGPGNPGKPGGPGGPGKPGKPGGPGDPPGEPSWKEPDPDARHWDVPEDHVFGYEIGWLAANGVTRGCNPPDNTRFCPEDPVGRGQMAAFLVRALGLTETDGTDFVDDDGSIFEREFEILAAAGIVRGCNPPDNDRVCPDDPITRGQMAAFLVRALGLTETDGTDFVDDDGSIFEGDIERLAAAGITRGCNPPDNDRFCPDDPITRGQMAAFLFRALTR